MSRVKIPSVTISIRVCREIFEPKRTRKPTVSPTRSPSVCAMRSAAARAASRRGSSTRMRRSFAQSSPSKHQRHPRRLAGAGRRHQDGYVTRAQRRGQFRQCGIDRQRRRIVHSVDPMTVLIGAKPLYTGHHARSTKSPAQSGKTATFRQAVAERRPRLPGRRLGLHFPRLSRAAADQPQIRRAAAQCRIRLLQHAVEASARHEAGGEAHAPCRGVRPFRAHLPHRDVSRLQGAPARPAGRFKAAIPADPRRGARLRHSLPGAEGF